MSAAKPARQFVHATKIFPSSLKNCEQLISKEMNMILNSHTMTIVGLALLLEYMCKHKKKQVSVTDSVLRHKAQWLVYIWNMFQESVKMIVPLIHHTS